MENYKNKLKKRANSLSLVAGGTLLLYLGFMFYRDQLPELPSFIQGFQVGAFLGLELFVVMFLGKYMKAARNEALLKQMYIKESDERSSQILQNAASLSISIVFIGLGITTVVAGFFNPYIFFTLMGALFFIMIVFFTLMGYYSRKI